MARNSSNLKKAWVAKNDEFYTRLEDIESELRVYGRKCEHFKDKVILCPCDESEHTNFYKHFMMNFEEYGLKKLICVGYRTNRPAEVHIVEKIDDGIVEKNVQLVGNGDFRNEETQKFFDECDVVVTNPPFSLFREFVTLIIEKNKKFLIIGNKNAVGSKEIFPLVKKNLVWLGYTSPSKFIQLESDEMKNMTGLTRWFTNLEIPKRTEKFDTRIEFEYGNAKGWYQKFDNYDAINVNETKQIPMDYDGLMGVPITFLDKYNPEQFEIVGLFNRYSECDYENGFICGEKAEYVDSNGKILRSAGPVASRKSLYNRILIKRK